MSKELEANEDYELLSDDVFQFDNGNTLTVEKLKELFRNQFWEKFLDSSRQRRSNYSEIKSDLSLLPLDPAISVFCSEIQWKSTEISCKLLKVGSTGWQKGKLKIQANVVNSSRENGSLTKYKDVVIDICVEFSPDISPELTPPLETFSPLDKIKQSEE